VFTLLRLMPIGPALQLIVTARRLRRFGAAAAAGELSAARSARRLA